MTTGTRAADRAAITNLLRAGCTPSEATNLLGLSSGLRPIQGGWSLREIERLRFLRVLVETGRVSG